MTDERRAIVWCWLAIMFSGEADDIDYAYPPRHSDEDAQLACALQERSDACYAHARKLDDRDDLWERAQRAWQELPNA